MCHLVIVKKIFFNAINPLKCFNCYFLTINAPCILTKGTEFGFSKLSIHKRRNCTICLFDSLETAACANGKAILVTGHSQLWLRDVHLYTNSHAKQWSLPKVFTWKKEYLFFLFICLNPSWLFFDNLNCFCSK